MATSGPAAGLAAAAARTAATGLAGVAGLHALWGAGVAWPATDRTELADRVAGTRAVPDSGACWVVAGALCVAAGVVGGAGGHRPVVVLARVGVSAALLARSVTGLTGRTHHLVPWTPTARFVELDRRYYGPLCGLLGILALGSLRR